jgi:hypothetical protein
MGKKNVFFSGLKRLYLTKSSKVMRNFAGEKKKYTSTRAEKSLSLNKRLFRANSIFCPRDVITIFCEHAVRTPILYRKL